VGTLQTKGIKMKFREANRNDIFEIVKMIAHDKLGKLREDFRDPLPDKYYAAFDNIHKDDNQELIVLENDKREIIGTLQLSFIQYLTYQGGIRAQIEAVRIREDQRRKGIGEKMFTWAIERAKERKAHLIQLTTDKKRPDALRFYEKLGFEASHEGMKLHFR
jgi:GNAT superfamily N-acetyltransferase